MFQLFCKLCNGQKNQFVIPSHTTTNQKLRISDYQNSWILHLRTVSYKVDKPHWGSNACCVNIVPCFTKLLAASVIYLVVATTTRANTRCFPGWVWHWVLEFGPTLEPRRGRKDGAEGGRFGVGGDCRLTGAHEAITLPDLQARPRRSVLSHNFGTRGPEKRPSHVALPSPSHQL